MSARAKRRSTGATRKAPPRTPARVSAVQLHLWFNRALLLAAVAAVLGALVWGGAQLRAMPVKHIVVVGDVRNVSVDAVQNMIQPSLGGGFLGTDLDRIRELLLALPWVYEASVRRQWPDRLVLSLTGQTPIARWGSDAFLNHEGEVFVSDKSDSRLQSLPLLRGPQGSHHPMMADYLRLNSALTPLQLRVEELVMDARGELRARVDKGFWLVLGRRDLTARLKRFEQVYPGQLALGEPLEHIDLRYDNGLAVAYAKPAVAAKT